MIKHVIRNRDITSPFGISSSSSFAVYLNLTIICRRFLTLGKRYSLYILTNIISSSEVLAYLGFLSETFIKLKGYYLLTTLNIILDLNFSFFIIFYI